VTGRNKHQSRPDSGLEILHYGMAPLGFATILRYGTVHQGSLSVDVMDGEPRILGVDVAGQNLEPQGRARPRVERLET
jgi:hypothetical protein